MSGDKQEFRSHETGRGLQYLFRRYVFGGRQVSSITSHSSPAEKADGIEASI
jgi:hypothetical protein